MFRLAVLFCAVSLWFANTAGGAQESSRTAADTQEMSDFSLSGFGDKGAKAWDVKGKSADIGTEIIKLNDIVSNFYGAEETVRLTAKTGNFNRREGNIHLQDDVVVTTSTGARLLTDALDWDRKRQIIETTHLVRVYKADMTATGLGAKGFPDLNKLDLEKNVTVRIDQPQQEGGKGIRRIEITCDGALQVDYQKNIATFNKNVKVTTQDGVITGDQMEVYFSTKKPAGKGGKASIDDLAAAGSKIERIYARGNVTINRAGNVSYSEEAVYSALENKITLLGRPKLVIYSSEGLNAPSGN